MRFEEKYRGFPLALPEQRNEGRPPMIAPEYPQIQSPPDIHVKYRKIVSFHPEMVLLPNPPTEVGTSLRQSAGLLVRRTNVHLRATP